MAFTVCFYCDSCFYERLDHCDKCGKPQMDILTHAQILASQMRAKSLEKEKEMLCQIDKANTEELAKSITLEIANYDVSWLKLKV